MATTNHEHENMSICLLETIGLCTRLRSLVPISYDYFGSVEAFVDAGDAGGGGGAVTVFG
eukprot:m.269119 g.269119  ORF g.269119 m.269119 type:complete len:60 (-) comp15665_c2_seq7:6585-6764(-)